MKKVKRDKNSKFTVDELTDFMKSYEKVLDECVYFFYKLKENLDDSDAILGEGAIFKDFLFDVDKKAIEVHYGKLIPSYPGTKAPFDRKITIPFDFFAYDLKGFAKSEAKRLNQGLKNVKKSGETKSEG